MHDPATALRELPLIRQAALGAGYQEQALWPSIWEEELRYALGNENSIHALAETATKLAENLGAVNELLAEVVRCGSLACDHNWRRVTDVATDTLRGIKARGVGLLWMPRVLALIGTAEFELGNLQAGRAVAQEGVAFMRESQAVWSPRSYAVLARAQLALAEPVADIAGTLEEYEALLTRTGFHVYEGELHELRARLAEREGQQAERAAALATAHDCYTRFGMIRQAARITALSVE